MKGGRGGDYKGFLKLFMGLVFSSHQEIEQPPANGSQHNQCDVQEPQYLQRSCQVGVDHVTRFVDHENKKNKNCQNDEPQECGNKQ